MSVLEMVARLPAKIYLSGPMTDKPFQNFPRFKEVTAALRAEGIEVVSPVEMDEGDGFVPDPLGTPLPTLQYNKFLARDFKAISDPEEGVEAVVVLEGWEESTGARREVQVARWLGKPIYALVDGKPGIRLMRAQTVDWVLSGGSAGDYYPTGREDEVRVINDQTGGAKGSKLERFDLLPWEQIAQVAKLYGKGAEKYEPRNWEKGYDWSLSFAALHRHLAAFWGGEYLDQETGQPHLASVVFHALALMFFAEHHLDLDDRP